MLLDGVAEVCEDEGLALVLIDRRSPQPDRPDVLRNALVDGVIIHCDALDADRLKLIEDRQLPTVVLDAEAIGDGLSVGIDDEGGASAAAQHIVDLGHRRVAVLSLDSNNPVKSHLVSEARRRGYLGPARRAGCDTTVEAAGGLDWDEFASMVRGLLRRQPMPTAILAMSDDIAAGVVRVADALGVAIPDQLSVVGFDDTPVASGAVPPLTTVRQNHAAKGRLAARMLLGQIEAKRIRLPVELVVRGSTAPPARGSLGSGLTPRLSRRDPVGVVVVVSGVVLGEGVATEVRFEVAPHRVDVVDAALGVVVFGEQAPALDPVVVGLAGLDATRPGERQLVEIVVGPVLLDLRVRQFVGDPVHVDVEEGTQELALVGPEVGGGDALRCRGEADRGEVLGPQPGVPLGRLLDRLHASRRGHRRSGVARCR